MFSQTSQNKFQSNLLVIILVHEQVRLVLKFLIIIHEGIYLHAEKVESIKHLVIPHDGSSNTISYDNESNII